MILNSPYISGSLTVTGNTTLQGALTVTGSLSGTASTASFALTLDGTGSVGFATTGAFTATSGSASSRLTQIEQVYATTGSNSFRATQSITGSLTVTGQIVAQTLNVQQVTSSIVYSSGSNVFGCDLNSRQIFTGSFYQTGSIANFSNCVIVGGALNGTCAIFSSGLTIQSGNPLYINNAGNTRSGSLATTANGTELSSHNGSGEPLILKAPDSTAYMSFNTAGCERLRISSEGYLGTTVSSTTISDGDLLGVLAFVSRDSSTYSSGGITNIRSYATQTYNTGNVAGDMRFYVTNGAQNTTGTYLFGTEAMRITCNGNVVIGNTTAYGGLTVSDFSANDGNDAISLFYRGTAGGHESLFKFYDFRGQVNAAMGNNLEDDGPGTQKGRLVFKTSCNGSPVERMRIASNGVVRIGTCAINTNANSNVALQVAGAIRFGNPDGDYVQSYGGGISARSCNGFTPGSTAIIVKGLGGSGFLYQVFGFTLTGKRFTDLLLGVNTIITVVSSVVEGAVSSRCYTVTSENLNLCLSGAENYNIVSHGFGAVER